MADGNEYCPQCGKHYSTHDQSKCNFIYDYILDEPVKHWFPNDYITPECGNPV